LKFSKYTKIFLLILLIVSLFAFAFASANSAEPSKNVSHALCTVTTMDKISIESIGCECGGSIITTKVGTTGWMHISTSKCTQHVRCALEVHRRYHHYATYCTGVCNYYSSSIAAEYKGVHNK